MAPATPRDSAEEPRRTRKETPRARLRSRGRGALRRRGESGAFTSTLGPIRPRSRGARRSLRTFADVSLRPGYLDAFNPDTPTSTPFNSASDAFQLHPDVDSRAADDPQCDAVCSIPTGRLIESLSVSHAAVIILSQYYQARVGGGGGGVA